MTLSNQIQAAREQLQARAQTYRDTAISAARGSFLGAADRVAGAKQPVRALALAGQRLSSLSNRYFEQFFGQQAHTFEGVIEGGVERLKRAAKADSLAEFVSDQRELTAAARDRITKDLKATLKIASDTGTELRDLWVETYVELVNGVKPRRASSTRTVRTAPRSKTTKKAVRARKAR